MKTWEEFKNRNKSIPSHLERTNIVCPQCGGNTPLYRHTDVEYATYPPMHSYECLNCGWHGVA